MFAAELAALSPTRVRKLVLTNAVGLWIDEHPVADFFVMTPDQLAVALWHDPESAVAKAMMAIPEDEQAQLEAYLLGAARGELCYVDPCVRSPATSENAPEHWERE